MTREWFTTYCQNAAANVLTKDNKIRFGYEQLHSALNNIYTDKAINDLHSNIVKLCNSKLGAQEDVAQPALMLTLLNIHAAYLMLSGLWKEEPVQSGGTDEYGFEIF